MISRSSLVVSTLALIGGNAWSERPPPPHRHRHRRISRPPSPVRRPRRRWRRRRRSRPRQPLRRRPAAVVQDRARPGNTLKLGLLVQPQFQSLGNNNLDGNSYNLFIRRTRFLVGGTVLGMFDFFFETDYPNLFLATNEAPSMTANATTTKNTPGMNIQDAFITWKPLEGRTRIQNRRRLHAAAARAQRGPERGVALLLGLLHVLVQLPRGRRHQPRPPESPVGRDLGVEARGLVLDGHLEYRIGLFQGLRVTETPAAAGGMATTVGADNFFRGPVVCN